VQLEAEREVVEEVPDEFAATSRLSWIAGPSCATPEDEGADRLGDGDPHEADREIAEGLR
jgi:hypothetical protein